jgi:hypothetical protein
MATRTKRFCLPHPQAAQPLWRRIPPRWIGRRPAQMPCPAGLAHLKKTRGTRAQGARFRILSAWRLWATGPTLPSPGQHAPDAAGVPACGRPSSASNTTGTRRPHTHVAPRQACQIRRAPWHLLPPLGGVGCFSDRVPAGSLRSTTGGKLCFRCEQSTA